MAQNRVIAGTLNIERGDDALMDTEFTEGPLKINPIFAPRNTSAAYMFDASSFPVSDWLVELITARHA